MNIDRALEMINHYLIEGCINTDWRECLSVCRETIKSQQEQIESLISGQETLQKYHHDATEVAYKNGYEAGVRELAEELKNKAVMVRPYCEKIVWFGDILTIAKELTGGSEE